MKTKNIIIIGLVAAAAIAVIGIRAHADTIEGEDPKPLSASYEIVETTDLNKLNSLIQESQKRMDNAHDMAEAARNLSYDEEHTVIQLAQDEYAQAKNAKQHYESKYAEQKKIEEGKKMYAKISSSPVAGEVWAFLKSKGYNDAVTAGILGNMMQECGGGTLDLNPYVYNPTGKYYGLCQWSKSYGIHGASTLVQLNYLANTLESNFNTYGRLYKSGFTYKDFCNLTSPEEAAKAYLYAYGRGSFGTCSKRQANARTAYNYFVN